MFLVTGTRSEETVIVIPDSQPQVPDVVMVEDDEQESSLLKSTSSSPQGKSHRLSKDHLEERKSKHRGHNKETSDGKTSVKSQVVRPVSRSSKEKKKRRRGTCSKGIKFFMNDAQIVEAYSDGPNV